MKNKKITTGFTLIELLVVVAIIGLLLGIATDYLSSARSKGRGAGTKQNLNSLRTALPLWQTNNNNDNLPCDIAENSYPIGGVNKIWSQAKSGAGSNWSYSLQGCANNSNTSKSGTAFIFVAQSGAGKYWCVDSNNSGKELSSWPAGLTTGSYTSTWPGTCP